MLHFSCHVSARICLIFPAAYQTFAKEFDCISPFTIIYRNCDVKMGNQSSQYRKITSAMRYFDFKCERQFKCDALIFRMTWLIYCHLVVAHQHVTGNENNTRISRNVHAMWLWFSAIHRNKRCTRWTKQRFDFIFIHVCLHFFPSLSLVKKWIYL